jgi:hypothetical protein
MRAEQIQQALVLMRFQLEVKRQCDFSLEAFRGLDDAVRSYKAILGRWPNETVHDEGVIPGSDKAYLKLFEHYQEQQDAEHTIDKHGAIIWFCIQSLLVSVANLSKLLWPTKQNSSNFSQRLRQELRISLEIEEGSVLKSKKFRNYFEHFDEYLEKWAIETTNTTTISIVDSLILPEPIDLHDPELFDQKKVFRHYDPVSEILTFQGKTYALRPIRAAVRTLHQKATTKVAQSPLVDGDKPRA